MDTSETYIKMCDCPEIQKEMSGRPKLYLAYYLHGRWQVEHDYLGGQKSPVLLPMQDQIQEMLITGGGRCGCMVCLVTNIYNFMENNLEGMFEAGIEGTMELLWLAYYMCEKHGLMWENGKWKDNG